MTKTILIVESDELNLKLFNDILQVHSYKTVLTLDERLSIDLAREHSPDLIIMGIQMPSNSSLEITKVIKADDALKKIPILAVTALAMKDDEKKHRNSGCDGYLTKPISIPQFIETIHNLLK